MSDDKILSRWIKSVFYVILFLISLLGYGSIRSFVQSLLGNIEYRLGAFEGSIATVFFFYFADKYAPALSEFINGIRAIGRQDHHNQTDEPEKISADTEPIKQTQPALSFSLPSHIFEVKWNLSRDVMPVPPYGSKDIPNSDSESKLIVHQLEGEVNVKIICDMKGFHSNSKYRLDVCNSYIPYSEWPNRFSKSIEIEHFVTDSMGCGKIEFNLRSSDFPNPGVHTISMWLNLDPGGTILISDNFPVRSY